MKNDDNTVPFCPHCNQANLLWSTNRQPQFIRKDRKCLFCGKMSTVWYYKVFVVEPSDEITKERKK